MPEILKKISVAALMLVSAVIGYASEPLRVQTMEAEVKFGFTLPMEKYHGGNPQVGMAMSLGLRYNFEDAPYSLGLELMLTTAMYGYKENARTVDMTNRLLSFLVLPEYDFRQGKKVNPYVAFGVGCGSIDTVGEPQHPGDGSVFVLSPRAGVELLYHIRAEAQVCVSRRGYHNVGLTLGLVIGGRPKKISDESAKYY